MGTLIASDSPVRQGRFARAAEGTAGVRAGVLAGAISGAVVGGLGGRLVMRIVYLIDTSTDGAKTDFATVGDVTAGGTLTLIILTALAGIVGGLIYVAVRRWLPWSGAARGAFFGLLMMFGPGVIAVSEIDLQIFEPALPVFAMFVALIVLYGIAVALLADRLRAPAAVRPGPRMERAGRALVGLAALGICVMAVLAIQRVYDHAGSCLSADDNGGCAARPADR